MVVLSRVWRRSLIVDPCFFPCDPLLSHVLDLATHYLIPVSVSIGGLLDKFIKATPYPRCGSSRDVACNGWDPQRRTVHGKYFKYLMIGKQHSCKSYKWRANARGKGKAGGPVVDGCEFAP